MGLHTCYNGGDNGQLLREKMLIPKNRLSSDCTLQLECMKVESLVIAGQLYSGEYVPGSCTHCPSHHGSRLFPKLLLEPSGTRMPKAGLVTGGKS